MCDLQRHVLVGQVEKAEPDQHDPVEEIRDLAEELAFQLVGQPQHHEGLDRPAHGDPLTREHQRDGDRQEEDGQTQKAEHQLAVGDLAVQEVVDVSRVEHGRVPG